MNNIKKFRKMNNMTQQQFAEKAELSASTISKAENGYLSLDTACGICNAYPDDFEIKNLCLCLKDNRELATEER